jgi:hypothetical protein
VRAPAAGAGLWVAPAYGVVALAITWPLARVFGTAVPAVPAAFHPLVDAFVLGWDRHAFATGVTRVFDAPMFYPEHRALAFLDPLLGEAALSAPVAALTHSAAAAYNALVVFSFVAGGSAVYRLMRTLGASRAAGFVSGLVFALAPYRMARLGDPSRLGTALVPLALMFALRFAARRRIRDLAATFVALALQSYFGRDALVVTAAALALTLACARGFAWPGGKPVPWRPLAAAAALTLIAVLPGALPSWRAHASAPGLRAALGTAATGSADVMDYARLDRESTLGRVLHLPRGARACSVGVVTLVLALAGIRGHRRKPRGAAAAPAADSARPEAASVSLRDVSVPAPADPPFGLRRFDAYLAILATSAFVLSLGPILQIAGRRLPVPLPYAVLSAVVPGLGGIRAPASFAELVLLVAAILAARGFDALRARLRGKGRALLAATIAAVVVAAWSAPIPVVTLPARGSLPPAYAFIARQPGRFAILELPMPASAADEGERDAVRQLWSLEHGKVRIDGVGGFASPAHESFRALMRSFPDPLAVSAIVERGARFVIVRLEEYAPEDAARIAHEIVAARELTPVFESRHDVVYAVTHADLMAARAGEPPRDVGSTAGPAAPLASR